MRKILLFCCLMSVFFLPTAQALAETQYISDEIAVTLRRGPGTEYKILKSLKTGTPVEVVEEGENYLLVRIKDGTEGYILRQYLTGELPKSMVIARLNQEKERLQNRMKELEELGSGWTTEKAELQRQIADIQEAFRGEKEKRLMIAKSYQNLQEGSKNVTELIKERDQLKAENKLQSTELQKLRQENDKILRKAMVQWFLAGGGVLFLGWFMGKRSQPKKRGF